MIRPTAGAVLAFALAGCATTSVRTDHSERASFAELSTYTWLERSFDSNGDPAINSPLLGERIQYAVDGELASRGFRRVDTGESDFKIAYRFLVENRFSYLDASRDPASNDALAQWAVALADGSSYPTGSDVAPEDLNYADAYLESRSVAWESHHPEHRVHSSRHVGVHGHGVHGGFHGRHHGYHRPHFGLHHRYGAHHGFHAYGHHGYYPYDDAYYRPSGYEYVQGTLILDIYDGRTSELIWRGWITEQLDPELKPDELKRYVTDSVQKILAKFPPPT